VLLSQIDPRLVGAPFIYDTDDKEFDFEFTRWNVAGAPNRCDDLRLVVTACMLHNLPLTIHQCGRAYDDAISITAEQTAFSHVWQCWALIHPCN
jgi:hypothetical protein